MSEKKSALYEDFFAEDEPDEEVEELCRELKEAMEEDLKVAYESEDYDDNILNLLLEDEYLTEEMIDKLSMVNILEQAGEGDISDETLEKAYLSLTDTIFEMSKTINPLGGFNKGRLRSGLDIIRDFEERHWPLATVITPENITMFSDIMHPYPYDEVAEGRIRAIGALRHVGDDVYAAGVICYSVRTDTSEDEPVIHIEYINVHESLRSLGIGNHLMAEVLGLAHQNAGSMVTIESPLKIYDGETEELNGRILENFLDSWRFQFSIDYGRSFVLKLDRVKGNSIIDKPSGSAVSLRSLSEKGSRLLGDYFRKEGHDYDNDIAALSYGYFDPDISCVIMNGIKIRSLFLVHSCSNGDIRYIALRCDPGNLQNDYIDLLRFAYKAAVRKDVLGKVFFGEFDSMEGRDIAAHIVPDIHLPFFVSGILAPPDDEITNEMWDELRKEAGLSDDKLPDDDASLSELNDTDIDKIKETLTDTL